MKFLHLFLAFQSVFDKKNSNTKLSAEINGFDINYCASIVAFIPSIVNKIHKNIQSCTSDNDCENDKKCCRIYQDNYCCDPNNFVYIYDDFYSLKKIIS